MIIYKITNKVNGKIYIGQTTMCLKRRFANHCVSKTTVIGKAIKKYGKECFDLEEIDSASSLEELSEKEIYWISYYNSTNIKIGYNLTTGGHTGYIFTKEVKEIISKNSKGKPNHKNRVKVQIVNLETGERVNFTSQSEASKWLNVSINRLAESCKKTKGGRLVFRSKYTAVYEGDDVGEIITTSLKAVSITQNGIETIYKSIIDASRKLNLDRDVVKHFALYEVKDKYGREWKFKTLT